jgi:peptidoglycan/LPS O-acetylase OafA/YrhL
VRAYVRRRAARILPAYWTVLTAFLIVNQATGDAAGGTSPSFWPTLYTLTQTYHRDTIMAGIPPAWSLCVEASFYLLLPIFAIGVHRMLVGVGERLRPTAAQLQLSILTLLIVLSLAIRWVVSGSLIHAVPDDRVVLGASLPALLDWFAVGMALAVLTTEWEHGRRLLRPLERLSRRPRQCWAVATVIFVGGSLLQGSMLLLPLRSVVLNAALGIAAGLVVLPLAIGGEVRKSRIVLVLSSRPVVWLGTVSYGVYLLHQPVILQVRRALNGTPANPLLFVRCSPGVTLATLALAVPITLSLSALSWYLIERPAQRRWGTPKWREARREPTAATAPRADPEVGLAPSSTA